MAELLTAHWLVMVVASVVVLGVAFAGFADAPVARRVFRDFVFLVAAPLVVLFGWALVLLARVSSLPSELWQALIAGLVIASGWLTTAIFNELSRARAKSERLRDYHKAVYAEIGTALQSLWDEGRSEAATADTVARMRADPGFIPFIPRETHDQIYSAILGEIEVLPRQTIDAIVAYYSLARAISALAEDMRGERFRDLAQDRRIAMYGDYAAMRNQAFAFGQFALKLIQTYSDQGPSATEALLSNRGAGRSGP